MQKHILAAVLCLGAFSAGSALAAVSPEQAARLGQDLTSQGAELAGNADGSIPAWDPAGIPTPAAYVPGSWNFVNPYPDEKPLFQINGTNWEQYAENLTVGSQAMLKKYGGDGYVMDVYPTHRNYLTPDFVATNNVKNATGATLVADGQKVDGNYPGVPFPMPQAALEVMWNHMVRYGVNREIDYDTYYVDSSGKPVLATSAHSYSVFPMYDEPDQIVGDTPWTYLRIDYNAPNRRAGEILLVHEPGADYTEGKGRSAWQYLTGQRRVRLAPAVSFDTPNPGVAGTSTYDDSFIYNGSPERFDWKLMGKKEMYIPYNSHTFVFEKEILDTLGEKFIDPAVIRWEKHRVWVVDSTLKEGKRHLYSRRTFYIDEDSWTAVAGEMYDGRGELWRTQFAYPAGLYDGVVGSYDASYGSYDLLQNIYNINAKPIPGKLTVGSDKKGKYFTAKGMARGGVR